MPNTLSTLANTIAGAISSERFQDDLKPHAAFLSATTLNPVEPSVKKVNDVVAVPLPTLSGSWQDHQTTPLTAGDISNLPINVTLTKTPSRVVKLSSHEIQKIAQPQPLVAKSIRIALLQLLRDCSEQIGALFTTTNFNVTGNSDRSGTTGADYVTRAQLVNLYGVLDDREIPVDDTGHMFAITNPTIHALWTNDDAFTKADTIGEAYASKMRVSGSLVPINNMLPLRDSRAPKETVVGPPAGTTFTTAVFHRNATFAQFAYPEPPLSDKIDWSYANIMGIPVLIVLEYNTNHGNSGGAYNAMTMSALWNCGVGRKDHGVIDKTPIAAA